MGGVGVGGASYFMRSSTPFAYIRLYISDCLLHSARRTTHEGGIIVPTLFISSIRHWTSVSIALYPNHQLRVSSDGPSCARLPPASNRALYQILRSRTAGEIKNIEWRLTSIAVLSQSISFLDQDFGHHNPCQRCKGINSMDRLYVSKLEQRIGAAKPS